MSAKESLDAKKVIALLESREEPPRAVAERLGVSAEAVDEARCLLEEIRTAEASAIFAMPPQLAPALLRAAVDAGRTEVLEEAALVERKEIRKEARRLARLLQSRGEKVELPPPPSSEPSPAVAPSREEASLPVLLSPIDSEGHRAMLSVRNLPGRGVAVARLVFDDRRVDDFETWESSRKRLRAFLGELQQGRLRLTEIPREEARRVLDRVRVRMMRHGGGSPDFATWAMHALGAAPAHMPESLSPVGEGRAPEDERELDELSRASDALFSEPEIAPWIPDEKFLAALRLRIDEAMTSPLYLPGEAGAAQRREAILAAVDREASRYFNEERRELYADWLLETARLFELQKRFAPARMAAATARRLREGVPIEDIGFARAFAHRLVEGHPALASSSAPTPPPIVRP